MDLLEDRIAVLLHFRGTYVRYLQKVRFGGHAFLNDLYELLIIENQVGWYRFRLGQRASPIPKLGKPLKFLRWQNRFVIH